MNKHLSQALQERFAELTAHRAAHLAPEKFAEQSAFVSRLREQLVNASLADFKKDSASVLLLPDNWVKAQADCLAALRALSLGEKLPQRPCENSPTGSFVKILENSKHDPERRFHLLAERYSCPLNFALAAEHDVREHILNRLMVQDRARIEKNSVEALQHDDLLLRLNLVSICAVLVPDLRFLDALNYYYELWPAAHAPHARHDWLLASYLGLYARALAVWS